MAIEIGRLAVKIAGRDAGKECLVINKLDDNFVMIDGYTRRRKCNIRHLELLPKSAKITKDASHADVLKALQELGVKPKKEAKKYGKPKAVKEAEKKAEEKKEKRPLLKILKKEKVEQPKEEKPKKAKKEKAKTAEKKAE